MGDRPDAEIAAAKRLGMRTVRVRRGEHRWMEPRNDDVETFAEAVSRLIA